MLLFILYGYGRMEATTEFQYISCYSLSRKGMGYGTSGMRVSIHLMLLFIIQSHSISLSSSMFQYISCYSLSGRSLSDVIPVFVSIHLMLLFIRASTTSLTGLSAVSIHLMLLFIGENICQILYKKTCFNTSHVTLYPQEKRSRAFGENSFNTSHVTLYQAFILCASLAGYCFNTSHVTLYLYFSQKSKQKSFMFQYISCYSLSGIIPIIPCTNPGFNTSHVTLYPKDRFGLVNVITFQYISCYSLS